MWANTCSKLINKTSFADFVLESLLLTLNRYYLPAGYGLIYYSSVDFLERIPVREMDSSVEVFLRFSQKLSKQIWKAVIVVSWVLFYYFLVYPLLSEFGRTKFEQIEVFYVDKELTKKGYNKYMNELFIDEGLIYPTIAMRKSLTDDNIHNTPSM